MSLKPLFHALMISAGLAVSATSASAQDWWKPYSGYSSRYGGYGSSCAGGVCRPTYGAGYSRSGRYGSYAHRPPYSRPYNTGIVPPHRDYHSPYSHRSGYSPFYD